MEKMLSNIMAECDRLEVSSVAFPAIGTGALGFPDDTVAKTMIQVISTYLHTHSSTTVKQVLLVIFEDKTYKAFQSVMQTSTSVPTPSYTQDAPIQSVTMNTVLCIRVYAGSSATAQQVLSEVEREIAEKSIQREMKDKNMDRLSTETKLHLKGEADKRHVVINFIPAPSNRIICGGIPTDVDYIMQLLKEEINKIEHDDLWRTHAEDLVAKIQWQWKKGNTFQDYNPVDNKKIEEAYQSVDKIIVLETSNGPVTVDTKQLQMREVRDGSTFSSVEIRRRNLEEERKKSELYSTSTCVAYIHMVITVNIVSCPTFKQYLASMFYVYALHK